MVAIERSTFDRKQSSAGDLPNMAERRDRSLSVDSRCCADCREITETAAFAVDRRMR
jgi:hypothetical protein